MSIKSNEFLYSASKYGLSRSHQWAPSFALHDGESFSAESFAIMVAFQITTLIPTVVNVSGELDFKMDRIQVAVVEHVARAIENLDPEELQSDSRGGFESLAKQIFCISLRRCSVANPFVSKASSKRRSSQSPQGHAGDKEWMKELYEKAWNDVVYPS